MKEKQPSPAPVKKICFEKVEADPLGTETATVPHLYQLPEGMTVVDGLNKVLEANRGCDSLKFLYITETKGIKTKFL